MIAYKQGFKYQLHEDYQVDIPFLDTDMSLDADYLTIEGRMMTIKAGYAWDGPSGPTFDTNNFMRGSLVHDALYQLIRESWLPRSDRENADKLLRQHCREDGMSIWRAWWVYRFVRMFGGKAVLPSQRRPILYAP